MNFYFLAMINAFRDKEMSEIFDYSQEVYPLISGVFARGIGQHELKNHDPEARTLAMMSALDGVLAYLLLNENLSFEEVISKFQEIFIDEIKI